MLDSAILQQELACMISTELVTFKLLARGSTEKFNALNIVKKCSKQGSTLTLVRSLHEKRVFGSYSEAINN